MKNIFKKALVAFALVAVILGGMGGFSNKAFASGEKFYITSIDGQGNGNNYGVVYFYVFSSSNTEIGNGVQANVFSFVGVSSEANLRTAEVAGVLDWATNNGYSGAAASDVFMALSPKLATVANTGSYTDLINLPASPTSYQTIVSQTGTSAPAVSGGMSPVNTYSGTTFTWARTGAGVYTITASQAVFNTSGKTGVFISPLNNLNASVRGVVTSSTVVTVTTAVQSVAVLGLLGLTNTNTDALLANSMIYIQTYP